MIRQTILYKLAPDVDEEEFLAWRLGPHQASNLDPDGVIASEFHRIISLADGSPARHRFMTIVDWRDWESLQEFLNDPDPDVQAQRRKNRKKLSDAVFLLSEQLVSQRKES